MYILENIEKYQKIKKIDLKLKIDIDDSQLVIFAGNDKNTDFLFDIMGSFEPKYEGRFYNNQNKEDDLYSEAFVNEISYSRGLSGYQKDMKISKYIKIKKRLAKDFDSEFLSRVLKKFNIDKNAKFYYLKEDYANIVLMAVSLAVNKKLTLLKNFDLENREVRLEFIDIILDRFRANGGSIFIRAKSIDEIFFDRMVVLKDGRLEFDQSRYEIINKAKIIKGSGIVVNDYTSKNVLSQATNGLETELKIYDEITSDEMDNLIGNKADVKQLPVDELIKFIQEGNYGKINKREIA